MNIYIKEPQEILNLGDVRVLNPNPEFVNFEQQSRIVAILQDHRKIDNTLTVVYLDKLTEIATDRDFVLTKNDTKSSFDLTLWTDFSVRVESEQLSTSPLLGKIEISLLKRAESFASLIDNQSFFDLEHKLPWQIGKYLPFYGDKVWLRRSEIMDSLNQLAADLDEEATINRFVKVITEEEQLGQSHQIQIDSIENAKILIEFSRDFARAAILV